MAERQVDHNGLEVLGPRESIELLRTVSVGRLGLSVGALPVVFPVNFGLASGGVVVRTSEGGKLDAATRNAVVCFEADSWDPLYHEGWSVMVTGRARRVIRPDELAEVAALKLAHWAPGQAEHFIVIPPEMISGRRLTHRAALTASGA